MFVAQHGELFGQLVGRLACLLATAVSCLDNSSAVWAGLLPNTVSYFGQLVGSLDMFVAQHGELFGQLVGRLGRFVAQRGELLGQLVGRLDMFIILATAVSRLDSSLAVLAVVQGDELLGQFVGRLGRFVAQRGDLLGQLVGRLDILY
jgi:prolipoprotein diacylglyceryltransferase